jgi:integrase
MGRRPEHLQLRGVTYHLRVRVPDELRLIVGKSEIRRSLGTSNADEAKRRVRLERVKVQAEFDDAKAKLAQRKAKNDGNVPKSVQLTEEQVWALATRWFVQQEKLQAGKRVEFRDDDAIEAQTEQLALVENWDEVSYSVHQEIDRLLAEVGLAVDRNPENPQPWRRKLARAIHSGMVERDKRLLNRMIGGAGMVLDPAFHNLSAGTELKPVSISVVTLGDLIKRYERDPARAQPSAKTKLKLEAQSRLFKEVIGDKTLVTAIDRDKARKLLDTVKALPSNATKRFPKKKIAEALDLAEARGLAPMSVTTANSYMSAFVSLLDFAVAENLIDKNPATGLRLASDGVRRQDKRLPFSPADLSLIFAAPLYTGCQNDEAGYARIGSKRPRRGRFWVPLVALYSGMRLNEACQLTEDDIAIDDNTDVILIRADDEGVKRVKTAAGHRFVPIHPELKRIGFLDHVADIRARNVPKTRLFPELTVASTGYASDNFSKWFAHFLDKVGIKDARKNFHSFRHTFRDALREAEIPQDRVRELGGWSSGSTEDDYGSGTRASTLAREIAKVRYDRVDLRTLYAARAAP